MNKFGFTNASKLHELTDNARAEAEAAEKDRVLKIILHNSTIAYKKGEYTCNIDSSQINLPFGAVMTLLKEILLPLGYTVDGREVIFDPLEYPCLENKWYISIGW